MKIELLQENLLKTVSRVGRLIPAKAQLPIMQNIRIEAKNGVITFTATNLETTETVLVRGKITEEGGMCVPARVFGEFVATLPTATVLLEVDDLQLTVKCEGFTATFPGIGLGEFPVAPGEAAEKEAKTPKAEFLAALDLVLFAAASDEGRPVLTGVKVIEEDGGTTLAATDGYRLGVKRLNLSLPAISGKIIPARALSEIAHVAGEEKDATELGFSQKEEGGVRISCGDTDLTTRLIDGEFPDFKRIIPKSWNTKVVVDKGLLSQAVKSAAIFARGNANIIQVAITENELVVSASAAGAGKNSVTVAAKVEGEGGEIAFNSRFLSDLFAHAPGEEVQLEMTGALNPGVFRVAGDESYLYVIMPVRVQE